MSSAATVATLRAALVATLVALYTRAFVVAAAIVATASMEPTLLAGDRVLVDRMLYAQRLSRPLAAILPVRGVEVGDVVWFRSPERPELALVKRCTAIEGELWGDAMLAPGTLAVEGDRRDNSRDSRAFGPIPRASVGGRVALVLWSAGPAGLRPERTARVVR